MKHLNKHKRGSAFLASMMLMGMIGVAGMSYLNTASKSMRDSKLKAMDAQMTQLCDAGIQTVLRNYWRDFKVSQSFDLLTACEGATTAAPKGGMTGTLPSVGKFSAAIISFQQPGNDTYSRQVTIRSVGYIDSDNDGSLDAGEPAKIVDVKATFQLARSQVFDYMYFVNNFGWMAGFDDDDLIVNGDMRANGDFSFSGGMPSVNGTVIAVQNEKLSTGSAGTITGTPVKYSGSAYNTVTAGSTSYVARMRQGYDSTKHGARGSDTWNTWRDVIFDTEGSVQGEKLAGSTLSDSAGSKGWSKTTSSSTPTFNAIDPAASQEVIMPDLGDINDYSNASAAYVDGKTTYADGTPNPYAGQGAWVDVWNSTTNSYQRVTTNGCITGSGILIGTETRPIKIHGPVTFSQDAVIKGYITGQGTIYTGRNVHIVGSLRYVNGPDFRGSSPTTIDQTNEKRDLLGLAARGSVIMGNPNTFNSTTLQYMTPPFTKPRLDENGNTIPAFNATEVDTTGKMRYKSVISDTTMNNIAEGINVIDAVLYTNFLGGGNLGTAGGGVVFNGAIISRDEAMVVYSLPMKLNYDTRIKERTLSQKPLVDIKLPRSPVLLKSTWQDRGTSYGNS